jgi:ribosomal protein S18 acetylase RimI-like enzyme
VSIEVRRLQPDDDHIHAGAIVRASYEALPGHPADPAYDALLADLPARWADVQVIVAVDDEASPPIVGCLSFVPAALGPHYEFDDLDATSFRYFGIAATHQGRGIGEAMVRWCIAETERLGRQRIRIHTLTNMLAAQRLYERLGFERDPTQDGNWGGIIGLSYVYRCATPP